MASNVTGGSVVWNFDVDKRAFDQGLKGARDEVQNLGNDLKKSQSGVRGWASDLGDSFSGIATGLGTVLRGATALAVGGSFGFTAMANAAWGQVSAVENASFALRAYERDGAKVNTILKDLVAYARSDLGVLFQREDLFKAASNLRGFGDAAENVVGHVKILSKGVSLGMTNFDELSQILGRATQQGKVSAETFDMLAQRGIILDSSFRGAAVTTEQLYGELNRVLPDSLLEGRANTIDGVMIRLKSAFRDLGGAILGVDKETSQFVKGGLGDTLVNSLTNLRTILRDPAMVNTFKQIGASIGEFAKTAIPVLISGFKFIIENAGALAAGLGALTVAFVAAKIAAIGFAIAAAANPATLIAAAVVALIGAITFLQLRFGFLTKALEALQPVFNFIKDLFGDLVKEIVNVAKVLGDELAPVFKFISKNADVFKKILLVIIAVALAPLAVAIGVVVVAIKAITKVLGFVADHFEGIKKAILVVIAVALFPITLAILAIIAAIKLVPPVLEWLGSVFKAIGLAIWAVMQGIWNVITTVFNAIWGFIRPILAFLLDLFTIVFGAILIVILTVLQFIKDVIVSVFSAIWSFLSPILSTIRDGIVAAFTFVWNIVSAVLTALWQFIVNIWNTIWNAIKAVVDKIIGFFSGAWNWLYDKGRDIVLGLARGIRDVASDVWNAIKSVADRIGQFFSGAWNWLYDVGRAIVEGLVRGIKSMVKAVSDAAGNIGDTVKNKVKNLLGIHSPSKVMSQLGVWTMEGFSKGIQKGNSMVMEAIGGSLDPVYEPNIAPRVAGMEFDRGPAPVINHIGEIHIGSEVDGENWLKRLTREEEVTSNGLTPYAL